MTARNVTKHVVGKGFPNFNAQMLLIVIKSSEADTRNWLSKNTPKSYRAFTQSNSSIVFYFKDIERVKKLLFELNDERRNSHHKGFSTPPPHHENEPFSTKL